MKYPKSHPLWPVYDLQQQIIKRGGKIDRHSDLLAYFEGRSLQPISKPESMLLNLAGNGRDYRDLIEKKFFCYKKVVSEIEGKETILWNYIKVEPGTELPEGYVWKPTDNTSFSHGLSQQLCLLDNEYIIRGGFDQVITLNPKYIDILRLLKNGYKQTNNEMKNKKLISSLIIGGALIIAALIYAFSTRYQYDSYLIIDKWKGTYQRIEEAK